MDSYKKKLRSRRYLLESIIKSLLFSLEQIAKRIGLKVNSDNFFLHTYIIYKVIYYLNK